MPMTGLLSVSFDREVWRREIFGPIMPILAVEGVEEAIEIINRIGPKPLIAYCYTQAQLQRHFRVHQQVIFMDFRGFLIGFFMFFQVFPWFCPGVDHIGGRLGDRLRVSRACGQHRGERRPAAHDRQLRRGLRGIWAQRHWRWLLGQGRPEGVLQPEARPGAAKVGGAWGGGDEREEGLRKVAKGS